MGYMSKMNTLRTFHSCFKGRRLEFEGVAVKHTACESCHQPISELWHLDDVHGGPYDRPEGVTDEDLLWCTYGEGDEAKYLYQAYDFRTTLEETDGVPPHKGMVRFTAIVLAPGEGGVELDKIEFPPF